MDVREKLVELIFGSLCRHIHKSCKLAENIADDLIKNGVTVQDNTEISDELLQRLRNAPITVITEETSGEVVQEWISVEERLPDVGKNVLVYSEYDGVSIDYHGGDSFGYTLVTHWMPLPEPPKGE